METVLLWLGSLALAAGFAAVTAVIARDKGHSALAYGLLGLCFPIAGLMVALMQPDRSFALSSGVAAGPPAQLPGAVVNPAEPARR